MNPNVLVKKVLHWRGRMGSDWWNAGELLNRELITKSQKSQKAQKE